MRRELTPRQSQIMALIRDHIRDTGFPPTRAEIARELGFRSANAAEEHLRALARRGVIELQPGTSRGIRLLAAVEDELLLPVVGRVAAGSPILAEEHIEDHYRLDPGLFLPRAHYLLRVHGSSMGDAGILDGDLLVVHRTHEAQNGQIVVARLEDEVTVKRFRRHARWHHRVQLLPESSRFEPILVDLRSQDLAIEGLGVGVLRMGLDGPRRL
jgi:repressor LexA